MNMWLHCEYIILCVQVIFPFTFSILPTGEDLTFSLCPETCNTSVSLLRPRNSIANCACDSQCWMFQDCCKDNTNANGNTLLIKKHDCVRFPSGKKDVYVQRKCVRSSLQLKRKCDMSQNYDEQAANFKLKVPVTSNGNITYGNMYCAQCNSDYSYEFWNMSVICRTHNKTLSVFNGRKKIFDVVDYKLDFDEENKVWLMNIDNVTEECILRPVFPSFVNKLRTCYSELISNCTVQDTYAAKKCPTYHAVVFDDEDTPYKNEYCAECNSIPLSKVYCRPPSKDIYEVYRRRFLNETNLNNFLHSIRTKSNHFPNTTNNNTLISTGNATNVNVNVTTTARSVPDTSETIVTVNTSIIRSQQREFIYLKIEKNCAVLKNINLTRVVTETVYKPNFNRTYVKNLLTIEGDKIETCYVSASVVSPINDHVEIQGNPIFIDTFLKFSTNMFLIVSAVFLLVYLYSSTKLSKSTTERAVISFAVTLLIGNIGFLLSTFSMYDEFQYNSCIMFGIIMYFSFLSSLLWTTAITFDICYVVVIQVVPENMIQCKNSKRSVHAILIWCIAAVQLVHMLKKASYPYDYFESCWLQGEENELYFLFPLTITVSLNIAFCSYIMYIVKMVPSSADKLIELQLHIVLIVVAALMWTTALAAGYFISGWLWLLFALFNALSTFILYIGLPGSGKVAKTAKCFLNERISFLIKYDRNE